MSELPTHHLINPCTPSVWTTNSPLDSPPHPELNQLTTSPRMSSLSSSDPCSTAALASVIHCCCFVTSSMHASKSSSSTSVLKSSVNFGAEWVRLQANTTNVLYCLFVTRSIVMRNVPQCTFPCNRLLIVYIENKSQTIWFRGFWYFWIVQISKFLLVLLHVSRKVKKVENKHDFWSVFVALFPRKPSLWAPKRELFMPFRWDVSNVSINTNHACVVPLERSCRHLFNFRFDLTKSNLDTICQPNKSS